MRKDLDSGQVMPPFSPNIKQYFRVKYFDWLGSKLIWSYFVPKVWGDWMVLLKVKRLPLVNSQSIYKSNDTLVWIPCFDWSSIALGVAVSWMTEYNTVGRFPLLSDNGTITSSFCFVQHTDSDAVYVWLCCSCVYAIKIFHDFTVSMVTWDIIINILTLVLSTLWLSVT